MENADTIAIDYDTSKSCCPFDEVVWVDPSSPIESRWRTETVLGITNAIRETKDFSRMPILADALQDAGCELAGILDHCRICPHHFPDCWLIDLLLDDAWLDSESMVRREESKEPVLVDTRQVPVYRTTGDRFDSCLHVAFYLMIACGIATLLTNAIRDHFRFAPR